MNHRRLIALGIGTVVLLLIVALAARGGTLHSGGGSNGPSALFWNYTATTLLIFEIFAFVGGIWVLVGLRPGVRASSGRLRGSPGRTMRNLLFVILINALLFFILSHLEKRSKSEKSPLVAPRGHNKPGKHLTQHLAVEWWEIIVVLALAAVACAVYVVRRKRRGQEPLVSVTAPEEIAAALDESLDDLRNDPDLRRAIVAAYARMERAFAAVGLPRAAAEAPVEYLERVLLSLDASAGAVRRLTDLFEWARFSHHEPEPSMRDEAVDALVAVRDELRNVERQVA